MAVYHDIVGADVSFTAAADLTLNQYHFVIPGSVAGEVKIGSGASNPTPMGVLQNAPSAGLPATVRLIGPTKLFCVTSGTSGIAFGRFLTANASGQGADISVAGSPAIARNIGQTVAVSASQFIEAYFFGGGLSSCDLAAS